MRCRWDAERGEFIVLPAPPEEHARALVALLEALNRAAEQGIPFAAAESSVPEKTGPCTDADPCGYRREGAICTFCYVLAAEPGA